MSEMMIFWMILLIVCIVIELPTMGLTTIWFAGGALAAILASLLHVPVFLQVVLFLVVSLLLLFFTRPIAVKYFNKDRVKTNVESMVGRQAIVTGEICNLHATGQVTVGGQEWSARSYDDQLRIPEGTVVTIVAIHGVKLIVRVGDGQQMRKPVAEAVSASPELKASDTPQTVTAPHTAQGEAARNTAQVVETSGTPQMREAADTSQVVETSGTPQVHEAADVPQVVETSGTPQVHETADVSQTVETSGTPQVHETADVPQMVETSGT